MAKLTLQETMDRLLLLIRAGYPVIYAVSHEEARVLDYLAKIFRVIKLEQPGKRFFHWYEGQGLTEITNLAAEGIEMQEWLKREGMPEALKTQTHGSMSASESLQNIKKANRTNFPPLADSLTVFFDIHPYLRTDPLSGVAASLVRPLRNTADELRKYYDHNRNEAGHPYKTIVIVAPTANGLSPELDRDLIVIDFPLPETDELLRTLNNMIGKNNLGFPAEISTEEIEMLSGVNGTVETYKSRLCDLVTGAGRGLTLEDYKLGLNMFAVRKEKLCARHIEDMLHLKAKAINNPALQYTPHVEIELGGLDGVRKWVAVRQNAAVSLEVRQRYHLPPPKGVMLCGASGGGKSQLAKLIAKEFNLALLRLDVGALFGSYIGESEERTRAALLLAEVLAPVVLWLDEIDKAFTGIGNSGDNGVSARVFGHFLTWLAEKQDNVFVVATANDYQALLSNFPEFGRKGRFDEIFWVSLPDESARREIFRIYLQPHVQTGYLKISETDIQNLFSRHNIQHPVQGQGELDRFCWILSQTELSFNMTGAEIEYAINEALYETYRRVQGLEAEPSFNPQMIAETVKRAMDRALYNSTTSTWKNFELLQKDALEVKHWTPAA